MFIPFPQRLGQKEPKGGAPRQEVRRSGWWIRRNCAPEVRRSGWWIRRNCAPTMQEGQLRRK